MHGVSTARVSSRLRAEALCIAVVPVAISLSHLTLSCFQHQLVWIAAPNASGEHKSSTVDFLSRIWRLLRGSGERCAQVVLLTWPLIISDAVDRLTSTDRQTLGIVHSQSLVVVNGVTSSQSFCAQKTWRTRQHQLPSSESSSSASRCDSEPLHMRWNLCTALASVRATRDLTFVTTRLQNTMAYRACPRPRTVCHDWAVLDSMGKLVQFSRARRDFILETRHAQ